MDSGWLQDKCWLVGCFGFSGPLRQYFSLYQAVSQREGERGEKGQRRVKMSKQPPPAPTASALGPCPTIIQIVGRPGTENLPRTSAPPDHPYKINESLFVCVCERGRKIKSNNHRGTRFLLLYLVSLTHLFSFLYMLLQSYANISTMLTHARHLVIVLDLHIPFSHMPPGRGLFCFFVY